MLSILRILTALSLFGLAVSILVLIDYDLGFITDLYMVLYAVVAFPLILSGIPFIIGEALSLFFDYYSNDLTFVVETAISYGFIFIIFFIFYSERKSQVRKLLKSQNIDMSKLNDS